MTDETKEIHKLEPAFPRSYVADGHNGMTLRDYFAGQAMGAMLAEMYQYTRESQAQVDIYRAVSISAYSMADQMLEGRSK